MCEKKLKKKHNYEEKMKVFQLFPHYKHLFIG